MRDPIRSEGTVDEGAGLGQLPWLLCRYSRFSVCHVAWYPYEGYFCVEEGGEENVNALDERVQE